MIRRRIALLLLALGSAPAIAEDWIGSAVDISWTTPTNWVGGLVPPSGYSTFLTFGPVTLYNSNADASWQVNRIDLLGPPRGLYGATLSFGGVAPALNATGGPHFMGNALDLQGDLTVTNDLDFTVNGTLSGPGSLTKSGPGLLNVNPAACVPAHGGTTTITAGTLRLNASLLAGPVVNNSIFEGAPTCGTLTLAQAMSGSGVLRVVGGTVVSGGPPFTHTGTTQLETAMLNGLFLGGGALVNNDGQLTTGDSIFSSITGNGNLIITGTAITVGADNSSTSYTGLVSGAGGLTKVGTGRLTIANAGPFYSGTTTISAGTLRIGNGTAGPPSIFGPIVDNAALEFSLPAFPATMVMSDTSGSGRLDVLQGWVQYGAGPVSLTGPVTVSTGGRLVASFPNGGTLAIAAGGQVESFFPAVHPSISGAGDFGFASLTVGSDNTSTSFTGPISGGPLTKVGTGTLILAGATVHGGPTVISSGTLRFGNGVTAPTAIASTIQVDGALEFHATTGTALASSVTGPGPLRVLGGPVIGPAPGLGVIAHTGGTQVDAGGTLSGQLSGFGPLTIAAGGRVDAFDGSGISVLSGAGELNVPGLGLGLLGVASSTFSGALMGPGPLYKGGASTLTLSGASTNAGGVDVGQGTLVVTGSLAGPVHMSTGTTLRGTGTIAGTVTIDAGATLAPGLSPGQVNTGNLALAGTAQFEILGPALGTQYDNINVTGTVTLTGATLQLIGAYVPVPGDLFTLITNDGFDAVTGTFTGLPEGSIVTFNGVALRLSYIGGTGNEVVLVAAPLAGYDWSGAGGNAAWSTNGNWVAGLAPPSAADVRVNFGAAGVTFAPSVDAPWTVNRIDMAFPGYAIGGSAITLTGVTPQVNASGALSQVISAPLVLGGNVTITTTVAMGVTGAVSGPGAITKAGTGTLTLSSPSTFAGGVTVNAGTLYVTGTIPGPVVVNAGGTLQGTGTITGAVNINAGGTMAPGLSPGVINTGNLALAGATQIEIQGTVLGAQYDNINVTGTVNIASTLVLIGAYVPIPGDAFTIITNDGADPVTGTFAALPEGATVAFNGVLLRVSYVGGTGNDVVLTAIAAAPPPQAIPTMSGWALALLASLLLAVAALALPRRPASIE